MSKLIMWNLLSLDGFFEGARSWDLAFHQDVWGEELERLSLEQLRSSDGLVFGRVTYEGMAAYWPAAKGEVADLMNRIPKVVFSHTLERADWNNTRLVKGDAVAELQQLKRQDKGMIFVFGSAGLSAALMQHDLFDEYRLGFAPVVLGAGKPLFPSSPTHYKLRLLEARAMSNGCVILRYAPLRSQ